MAFLSIAGVVYDVQTVQASENASAYVGEKVRAFANNYRSTRTTKKRQWSFLLAPVLQATYTTLRTNTDNDTPVNVTGDALAGAVVSCMVDVSAAGYLRDGLTFKIVPSVVIDEI